MTKYEFLTDKRQKSLDAVAEYNSRPAGTRTIAKRDELYADVDSATKDLKNCPYEDNTDIVERIARIKKIESDNIKDSSMNKLTEKVIDTQPAVAVAVGMKIVSDLGLTNDMFEQNKKLNASVSEAKYNDLLEGITFTSLKGGVKI